MNVNAIIERKMAGIKADVEQIASAFDSTPYASLQNDESDSAANASWYFAFTVPADELWLITGLSLTVTGAPAANTYAMIGIRDDTFNTALTDSQLLRGVDYWIACERLPIYLPEGWRVFIRANQAVGAGVSLRTNILYAKTTIPNQIPGD
jgi:hypothetical protein